MPKPACFCSRSGAPRPQRSAIKANTKCWPTNKRLARFCSSKACKRRPVIRPTRRKAAAGNRWVRSHPARNRPACSRPVRSQPVLNQSVPNRPAHRLLVRSRPIGSPCQAARRHKAALIKPRAAIFPMLPGRPAGPRTKQPLPRRNITVFSPCLF